jgi:hypothetical protein
MYCIYIYIHIYIYIYIFIRHMYICASRLLATFHPIFRLSQSSRPPPLLCPTTITRANMFPLPLLPLYNVDSAFVSSQPMPPPLRFSHLPYCSTISLYPFWPSLPSLRTPLAHPGMVCRYIGSAPGQFDVDKFRQAAANWFCCTFHDLIDLLWQGLAVNQTLNFEYASSQ